MNFYQTLVFVFLGILILLSFFLFRPKSDTNITFLSKLDLADILVENTDGYYNQFNKNDLKIRNLKTVDEYTGIIRNSCCDAPPLLQDKIVTCITKINAFFQNKTESWGIDFRRFLALPWNIGFTCDSLYEFGFPHTRQNVIILNVSDSMFRSELRLCRLLIHEKVHVYQKTYPEEMKTYLQSQSFLATKKDQNDTSIPANPDIDDLVYTKGNQSYFAKYETNNPTSFSDIQYSNGKAKYEHPYETMAYELEFLYS